MVMIMSKANVVTVRVNVLCMNIYVKERERGKDRERN